MDYDLSRATDRALRHVNVSAATCCGREAFAMALKTGRVDHHTEAAVRLFLCEGEEHAFSDIVGEGASSYATLAELALELLPPDHPTTRHLCEPPR